MRISLFLAVITSSFPILVAFITIFHINLTNLISSRKKYDLVKLLGIFLRSLIECDNEKLSKLIPSKMVNLSFNILLIRNIKDKRTLIALIVSNLHPGPFRSFGSTLFHYKLQSSLKDKLIHVIFLKAPTRPEWNILFEKELENIVEKVKSHILKIKDRLSYSEEFSGPLTLRYSNSKATMIKIGEKKMAFLTLHPNPMEDIPPNIIKNDEEIVVVDSHNCLSREILSLKEKDIKDLKKLCFKLSKIDLKGCEGKLKIGFTRHFPKEFRIRDGMGPFGISLLIFSKNCSEFALVVLDSNNSTREVRDEVEKRLISMGIKNFELVTTDTHTVNGLSLGGFSYYAAGERIKPSEIASYVEKLTSMVKKSLVPVEVSWSKLIIGPVNVFEESFIENLKREIPRALIKVKRWLLLSPLLFFIFLSVISKVLNIFG